MTQKKQAQGKLFSKAPKEIWVAIIAGGATLVTGIFGLIGVGLAGYFGYLGNRLPIDATQTAEATVMMELYSSNSSSINIDPSPQITNLVTTTPTVASSTQPITVQLSWSPIDCVPSMTRVLPNNSTPASQDVILDAINLGVSNGGIQEWPFAPLDPFEGSTHDMSFMVKISASPQNGDWAKISNAMNLRISSSRNTTVESVNVANLYGGCGTGKIRTFSLAELDNNFEEYTQTLHYEDTDFFTLEPGEFEIFSVDMKCKTPGAFDVNIDIEYELMSDKGFVSLENLPLVICPLDYSIWYSEPLGDTNFIMLMGDYIWDGTKYINRE